MPRKISLYIFGEMAVPFAISLAVLTVTALLSKVIKLVELLLVHGVGASFIFRFVLSVTPAFLIYTIPISFLIAVLVAFTRMSSDSEITAMKASGLSLFTMMRPVVALALVSYAATLLLMLYVFPWGNLNAKSLLFDAARERLTAGIEEKTFYEGFKGIILYVDRVSHETGEMEGIFISEKTGPAESNVFFAEKGVFGSSKDEFSIYLRLIDGTLHRKDPGSYHIADFSKYTLEIALPKGGVPDVMSRTNRELYPGELAGKVRALAARGVNTAPFVIDLHKRFALPASVFVFSLLGVPLGLQKMRSARSTGFSIALGVVLVYYVLSTALEAAGENGVINPVLSVWGSDIIMGAAGAYIFYMTAKDRKILGRNFR